MASEIKSFTVNTQGNTDIIDITAQVGEIVAECPFSEGTATVFAPGSTAGITTIEFESGAVADFKAAFERIAPEGIEYAHNARWGDGNGHSHVRAALLGASFSVPFADSRPLLGTWQQIVLVDFDNRPRERKIIVRTTS
ncbi:MAG: YjbQ family protein [Candidatus Mycalebacterium zealandia]|nr:MAG: YjbQ family protein [Candidatus Mycalebacterium zealandia]